MAARKVTTMKKYDWKKEVFGKRIKINWKEAIIVLAMVVFFLM